MEKMTNNNMFFDSKTQKEILTSESNHVKHFIKICI